jgi:hypothetical protein
MHPKPNHSTLKSLLCIAALLLIVIHPTAPVYAATNYYVATNGNDSNPGTLAQPWRTLQHAADTLAPGDTVYVRGGVYNERLDIHISGTSGGGFITYAAYNSETPIIDGTGIKVLADWNALVQMFDASYIRLDGFEIRNFKSKKLDRVPVGILVMGAGEHIELRNNTVHHIETKVKEVEGGDAHGIAVFGTAAPASYNHILIDGNELYALRLGSSESLVVNGNIENFAITHNTVHDNNNIGIDAIGFEGLSPDEDYDQPRDGVISDNLVYNIDSSTNPAYEGESSADCLYVDGGTRILLERNIAHHCNFGIELASEHKNRATSFITLRNNLFYKNTEPSISIGGYDKQRGRTENCTIVNNTLYDNDTHHGGSGEIQLQFDTRSNIIRNNLIYAGTQGLFIGNWSKANQGNVVNNNLYFTTGKGKWQWKNKTYKTFAAYQTATGNDANSLNTLDPLLVTLTTPDLHLASGSPAIDAGALITDIGTTDIDGDPRVQGGGVDIGADERE